MILENNISFKKLARIALLLVVLALALGAAEHAGAGTSAANAVDRDGNGYIDAYIREPGFLGAGNVGASCTYGRDANGGYVNINVRPPRMWPIDGFTSQPVAWHIVAINYTNPNVVWQSDTWNFGTAYSNQSTQFGGGDGYPDGTFGSAYWAGTQTLHLSTSNAQQWQPAAQVAWQNPNTGIWKTATLLVHSALISGGLAYPVC